MSWGTELWDQYGKLSEHTLKGIEFLDRYGSFVKERSVIELEYASKLRRLVKSYQPKKKDEGELQFSPHAAFKTLLQELGDFAGQHEVIAENLKANVVSELNILAKDLKEERKKCMNEGSKEMLSLQNHLDSLDRARRHYERSARDSERALEAFQRADANLNLSRAEVEKQKAIMKQKGQSCEDAKQEYELQLRKTNEAQSEHYFQRLPDVLKQFQDLDEKRIKSIKRFMLKSVEIETNVLPIIQQCLNEMKNAANYINEKEDTKLAEETYKSGFLPPGDIPFEEYRPGGTMGQNGTHDSNGHHHPAHRINSHNTVRGTFSASKFKRRNPIFSIFVSNKTNMITDGKQDFTELPPNQKKKFLEAKMQELSKQVAQEQAAIEGLIKMKNAYESNPDLGDPNTVEGQLNECNCNLEKLKAQILNYQTLLQEACSQTAIPPRLNGKGPSSVTSNRSDSLSRSASESSMSMGRDNVDSNGASRSHHNGTNHSHLNGSTVVETSNNISNVSPESGLGHETRTSTHQEEEDLDEFAQDSDYYEPEFQPLGYAQALYPCPKTSEGSMSMEAGERLVVLEMDQGDGWTRVRRHSDQEDVGFVPTTYIAITLYTDAH